jgi:phosphate transporter
MQPPLDWSHWFAVALPVSFISILLIWGLLVVSYKPNRSPDASLSGPGLVALGGPGSTAGLGEIEIKAIRPTREAFTWKQYWVVIVTIVTIGLWCVAHSLEDIVGDMGVIAILPILAFFGTGVLKKVGIPCSHSSLVSFRDSSP